MSEEEGKAASSSDAKVRRVLWSAARQRQRQRLGQRGSKHHIKLTITRVVRARARNRSASQ